jgi:hypothetical protein
LQQASGIEIGGLPADGDVKVGAGGAAGASAEAYQLAAFYSVSLFHFQFGYMEVQRK